MILLDADLQAAHQAANDIEALLGSGKVYRADKTITLAELLPSEPDLIERFRLALAKALQRVS